MMRILLAGLSLWAMIGAAYAQPSGGGGNGSTAPLINGALFFANAQTACVWNTTNDVGPCINAAIAAAAAAGGGTVFIPAGTYNGTRWRKLERWKCNDRVSI